MSSSSATYPSIEALSSNPERLLVLFAPFRAKSLNPDHYSHKMKFWYDVIKEFTEIEKRNCFTLQDVEEKLILFCNKKPACLQEVFYNLRRDGLVVPYNEYVSSLPVNPSSSFTWVADKVKWVATTLWSYNPIKFDSSQMNTDRSAKMVYVPHVKSQAEYVCSLPSLTSELKGLEEFKKEVGVVTGLKEDDIELLLKYLKATRRLIVDMVRDQIEVVKLLPEGTNYAEITQVEKGKYDIRRTINALEQEIAQLSEKREQAQQLAKVSLKAGKRVIAKRHLRNRNLLDKRIEKVGDGLNNLSLVAIQIDNAESDAKVVKAYEGAKDAMDQVFKEHNLNPDKVTDLIMDIQELMEDQENISNAISQPSSDNADISSIEAELEELLKSKEPSETEGLEDLNPDNDLAKTLDQLKIGADQPGSSQPTGRKSQVTA